MSKATTPDEVRALLGNKVAQQLEWYETRWRTAAEQWGHVRKRHHDLLAILQSSLTMRLSPNEWEELVQSIVKES